MGVQGINHLTLSVADIDRSLALYVDVLGCQAHCRWDRGAYLSAGDTWLCLSLGSPTPREDYTHWAFSVSDAHCALLRERLEAQGLACWQENQSEGDSYYFLDPDGHRLELHSGSLASRLASLRERPYAGLQWL